MAEEQAPDAKNTTPATEVERDQNIGAQAMAPETIAHISATPRLEDYLLHLPHLSPQPSSWWPRREAHQPDIPCRPPPCNTGSC